jgi:hypothetical protein
MKFGIKINNFRWVLEGLSWLSVVDYLSDYIHTYIIFKVYRRSPLNDCPVVEARL